MIEGKGLKIERGPRRYKVQLPVTVSVEEGSFAQGDEFEHVFDPEDEWENLDSGLLGLVPETYEVTSDIELHPGLIEAPATNDRPRVYKGDKFEAAIPLLREEQLRNHIRRVNPPAPGKPKE